MNRKSSPCKQHGDHEPQQYDVQAKDSRTSSSHSIIPHEWQPPSMGDVQETTVEFPCYQKRVDYPFNLGAEEEISLGPEAPAPSTGIDRDPRGHTAGLLSARHYI